MCPVVSLRFTTGYNSSVPAGLCWLKAFGISAVVEAAEPRLHFVQWHRRRGVLPVRGKAGFPIQRAADELLPLLNRERGQFCEDFGEALGIK